MKHLIVLAMLALAGCGGSTPAGGSDTTPPPSDPAPAACQTVSVDDCRAVLERDQQLEPTPSSLPQAEGAAYELCMDQASPAGVQCALAATDGEALLTCLRDSPGRCPRPTGDECREAAAHIASVAGEESIRADAEARCAGDEPWSRNRYACAMQASATAALEVCFPSGQF